MNKTIKELRRLQKSFRILRGWLITYGDIGDGRVSMSETIRVSKIAHIYPYEGPEMPRDYLLHEILHIALHALRSSRGRCADYETMVVDLCRIIDTRDLRPYPENIYKQRSPCLQDRRSK